MEVGVELRVSCAEGHAARNVVDIGAAADGNALARLAGLLLIAAQKHLDEFGIGGHLMPRFHFSLPGVPV